MPEANWGRKETITWSPHKPIYTFRCGLFCRGSDRSVRLFPLRATVGAGKMKAPVPEYRSTVRCGSRRTGRRRSGKNSAATEMGFPYFFAGECTERGRSVKGLRFAPTATRRKERALDYPPSPLLCCFQLSKNMRNKSGAEVVIWGKDTVLCVFGARDAHAQNAHGVR
jgi:hypothetical protein